MFDCFGERHPQNMPGHFFYDAIHRDEATAIRADISKQNFTVCPRYWYMDATFRCPRCNSTFVFTADEQRFWYEELGFRVDSCAKHCKPCRSDLRHLKLLRQEYDRDIERVLARDAARDCKYRMLKVIDELSPDSKHLPERMGVKRRILEKQIVRNSVEGL